MYAIRSYYDIRTLPWLRVMCGSDQNLDTEYNIMQTMLDNQSLDDGLFYYPVTGES